MTSARIVGNTPAWKSGLGALLTLFALLNPSMLRAQEGREADPASALSAALGAACRQNETQFANYLTSDSGRAFQSLPEQQRTALLKRFSLADGIGKTLVSSDDHNHPVVRCQAPEQTVEFRFGEVRSHENLAFVPVTVVDSQETEFGLVRENGGWRLLSLGLVLLDIPQLSKQWEAQDLAAREDAAVANLRGLADAIQGYRRAFGNLPESLAQLGPAPKDEISPEQASLVNERLAAGSDGGYRFRYRIVPAANESDATFELAATPDDYGKTGQRSFFLDGAGRVHGADKHGTVAAPDDPLLAGEKTP
jgi:type II secretory pathway pseudopilin PulG